MDWNLGRQLESPPLSQCDEKSPSQKLIFNNFHLFRLVGEGFNASVGRSSVEVRRFERFDVGRFLRRQNVESQRRKNAERRRHGNVKIRCRRETFFSGSSSADFKICRNLFRLSRRCWKDQVGAQLSGVKLLGAQLSNAQLPGAQLSGSLTAKTQ